MSSSTCLSPAARPGAALQLRALPGALGAELHGLRPSEAGRAATASALKQALAEHGLLLWRSLPLDAAALAALVQSWGGHTGSPGPAHRVLGHPALTIVSNIVEGGETVGVDDSGDFWQHFGSSSAAPPTTAFLQAVELPPGGAELHLADQAQVWDALPLVLRAAVAGLKAEHRFDHKVEALRARHPWRPMRQAPGSSGLALHPVLGPAGRGGAPALFVNERFTSRLLGPEERDAAALLHELQAWQTRDRFVTRHTWRNGDLLIWDNLRVQHRDPGWPWAGRVRFHRALVQQPA